MNLTELMSVVCNSTPSDWNHISCWGASSGPSYRDQFVFYETYKGDSNVLVGSSHSNVAAYIPDPSITLAFGLCQLDDFEEPWVQNFPDKHASASFVDVYYYGALVFRTEYVTVDGGRTKLPLPKSRTDLRVPGAQAQFIQLLDNLTSSSRFAEDFRRAGMSISDEVWPQFNSRKGTP